MFELCAGEIPLSVQYLSWRARQVSHRKGVLGHGQFFCHIQDHQERILCNFLLTLYNSTLCLPILLGHWEGAEVPTVLPKRAST
jgi:hypothetical protein